MFLNCFANGLHDIQDSRLTVTKVVFEYLGNEGLSILENGLTVTKVVFEWGNWYNVLCS